MARLGFIYLFIFYVGVGIVRSGFDLGLTFCLLAGKFDEKDRE